MEGTPSRGTQELGEPEATPQNNLHKATYTVYTAAKLNEIATAPLALAVPSTLTRYRTPERATVTVTQLVTVPVPQLSFETNSVRLPNVATLPVVAVVLYTPSTVLKGLPAVLTRSTPARGAVQENQTDADSPRPANSAGSPTSRVAPTVVAVRDWDPRPVRATEMGLAMGSPATATVMRKLPLAPPAPSTCTLYTVPFLTGTTTQLAPGEPPVVQLSLLTTNVRALTTAPV